jgi:hypothetical protein
MYFTRELGITNSIGMHVMVQTFNIQKLDAGRLLINPGAILAHAPFRCRARGHRALRLIPSVLQEKSDDAMGWDAFRGEVPNRSAVVCVCPQILQL